MLPDPLDTHVSHERSLVTTEHESYQNPLLTRYASPEMSRIWSAQKKHSTWRRLWVALAESQRELGLDISPHQVAQMAGRVEDVDFDLAAIYEKEFRHDVMAHVHAFKNQCPDAGRACADGLERYAPSQRRREREWRFHRER
jgi:hypothetical protein